MPFFVLFCFFVIVASFTVAMKGGPAYLDKDPQLPPPYCSADSSSCSLTRPRLQKCDTVSPLFSRATMDDWWEFLNSITFVLLFLCAFCIQNSLVSIFGSPYLVLWLKRYVPVASRLKRLMASDGKIRRKCKVEVCVIMIVRCSSACQVNFCVISTSLYNLL